MLDSKVVRLTPAMARKFLASNVEKNRFVSIHHVRKMTHAIRSGNFPLTGQPLLFSNGTMLDGQHRCHAVIEADLPIDVLVVTGVEADVFSSIDQGKARTASDFLDHPRRHALVSAGRLLYARDVQIANEREWRGIDCPPQDRPDNAEILRYVREHETLITTAEWLPDYRQATKLSPPSPLITLAVLFRDLSQDDATSFFESLATGADLASDDPVMHLRAKLIQYRVGSMRPGRDVIMAAMIIAWNRRRRGLATNTQRSFIWRATGSNAGVFPVPV